MSEQQLIDTIGGRFDVSRETIDCLIQYASDLKKWNRKINLVSPQTIDSLWSRHFLDSLQLAMFAEPNLTNWVDMGAGGGFPGLVLAAHFAETATQFTLLESDQRKSTFLRTVSRNMGLNVKVIADRIEDIPSIGADMVTARALAPLDKLLQYGKRHAVDHAKFIFPKGKNWQSELTIAQENWQMTVEQFDSLTDVEAKIIKLTNVGKK